MPGLHWLGNQRMRGKGLRRVNPAKYLSIHPRPTTEPMQNPKLSNESIQTQKKPTTISRKGFIH
jgi:hypothetical protein